MTEKKLFSIVFPVYNVEKYLEKSILSIVNQSENYFQKVQLIIVNDGSSDKSSEICKKYLELYPENVVYIEQENKGLGAARNTGLKYVTGEYIWFVDSDDFLSLDALKILGEEIDRNPNAEMFVFNHKTIYENPEQEKKYKKIFYRKNSFEGVYASARELYVILNRTDDFFVNVWLHLYKTNFLVENNLSFDEGIIFEDQPFSMKVYFCAGKTVFLDKFVYEYQIRDDSICTSLKNIEKKCYDNFYLVKLINEWIWGCNLSEEEVKWVKYRYSVRLNYAISRFNEMNEEQKVRTIFMCKDDNERLEFYEAIENPAIRYNELKEKYIAKFKKEAEKTRNLLANKEKELKDIKKGYSFKIGRFITWIPRKIRKVLKP